MTEEERKLLKENNEMLKFIVSYIYSQYNNSSYNDMKGFAYNILADMLVGGGRK